MGKAILTTLFSIVCLPGLLSATCSSNHSMSLSSQDGPSPSPLNPRQWDSSCGLNGWCGEDGVCNCNPCWTGSTCQDYVDRFPPRFLAEEPFFIIEMGSERDGESEVPLFRIESADDDLGLTCQLGQVGPAATCPCATPRYMVVGPSQTVFRADQETGDVFIKPGYNLQPGKTYSISLQVLALEVNRSGDDERWREELRTSLYIKPMEEEDFHYRGNPHGDASPSSFRTSPNRQSHSPASPSLRSMWMPSSTFYATPQAQPNPRSKRHVKSIRVIRLHR